MIVFGDSIFLWRMIQPLPAKAAQFQRGSRSGMAKSRRPLIFLSEEDRERLERIRTDPHSIRKHVERATIILHLGAGLTLSQTMRATLFCFRPLAAGPSANQTGGQPDRTGSRQKAA